MDDPDYIPEDATLYSTATDGNLEVMKRIVYKIQDAEQGLTTTALQDNEQNFNFLGIQSKKSTGSTGGLSKTSKRLFGYEKTVFENLVSKIGNKSAGRGWFNAATLCFKISSKRLY